jgi:protein subunit release factor A
VEGFAMLRRKIVDWMESSRFKQMQAEKNVLLSNTQSTTFWDNSDDARQKLSRYYFLDRLTNRLQNILEQCEYLEDLAILVHRERDLHYQTDLAQDYQDLHRDVMYLEVEMKTGHLPHRHRAMLLISRLGQSAFDNLEADTEWIRQLGRMYLEWAERKGYDRDLYLLEPHGNSGRLHFQHINITDFNELIKRFEERNPTDEIALLLEGSNVFGFLKGERGIHKFTTGESKDQHARLQVFAIPDGTDVERWLADYQRIKVEIQEGRRPAPPQEKHTVIRLYSLARQGERFVRDMRTGVRTVRVKDILEKGQLDEFILALVHKEENTDGIPWEDRFPPTFPF